MITSTSLLDIEDLVLPSVKTLVSFLTMRFKKICGSLNTLKLLIPIQTDEGIFYLIYPYSKDFPFMSNTETISYNICPILTDHSSTIQNFILSTTTKIKMYCNIILFHLVLFFFSHKK